MPDGYILNDNEWEAGIGVQHRPFLYVASGADFDRFVVATKDRTEPDANV
jgi:hypothetical protein